MNKTENRMESNKQIWLRNVGLAKDKSVIDCDPTKGTVKMLLEGKEVSRQTCQVFSRVMGFMAAKEYYNIGKKQETSERKYFSIDKLTADPISNPISNPVATS